MASKAVGNVDLSWNDCWQAPSDEVPDWVGTVDMDGTVYDLVFFNIGDGRPPQQDPPKATAPSSRSGRSTTASSRPATTRARL